MGFIESQESTYLWPVPSSHVSSFQFPMMASAGIHDQTKHWNRAIGLSSSAPPRLLDLQGALTHRKPPKAGVRMRKSTEDVPTAAPHQTLRIPYNRWNLLLAPIWYPSWISCRGESPCSVAHRLRPDCHTHNTSTPTFPHPHLVADFRHVSTLLFLFPPFIPPCRLLSCRRLSSLSPCSSRLPSSPSWPPRSSALSPRYVPPRATITNCVAATPQLALSRLGAHCRVHPLTNAPSL